MGDSTQNSHMAEWLKQFREALQKSNEKTAITNGTEKEASVGNGQPPASSGIQPPLGTQNFVPVARAAGQEAQDLLPLAQVMQANPNPHPFNLYNILFPGDTPNPRTTSAILEEQMMIPAPSVDFSTTFNTASYKTLLDKQCQGQRLPGEVPEHFHVQCCCGASQHVQMSPKVRASIEANPALLSSLVHGNPSECDHHTPQTSAPASSEMNFSSSWNPNIPGLLGWNTPALQNVMSPAQEPSILSSLLLQLIAAGSQPGSTNSPNFMSLKRPNMETQETEPEKKEKESFPYCPDQPTPDLQSQMEWKAYQKSRQRFYGRKSVPVQLKEGTAEYTERYLAAVLNSQVALAYKDEKMKSRQYVLFNPDRPDPIPQKVSYCVGVAQLFMDGRGEGVSEEVRKREWRRVKRHFPEILREWTRRRSDLYNEQLKQKHEGWIDWELKKKDKDELEKTLKKVDGSAAVKDSEVDSEEDEEGNEEVDVIN